MTTCSGATKEAPCSRQGRSRCPKGHSRRRRTYQIEDHVAVTTSMSRPSPVHKGSYCSLSPQESMHPIHRDARPFNREICLGGTDYGFLSAPISPIPPRPEGYTATRLLGKHRMSSAKSSFLSEASLSLPLVRNDPF